MGGGPTVFDTSRGVGGLNAAIKGSTGPIANWEISFAHVYTWAWMDLGRKFFIYEKALKQVQMFDT